MWVLEVHQNAALECDLSVVKGPADSFPAADVILWMQHYQIIISPS